MTAGVVTRERAHLPVTLGVVGAGVGTGVCWLDLYLVSAARRLCQTGVPALTESATVVFTVQPLLWLGNFVAFTVLFSAVFPLFTGAASRIAAVAGVIACGLLTAVVLAGSVWVSMAVWLPEHAAAVCVGGAPPWWPAFLPV
ncbi:hypothetical protein [Amycolatopsis suaedae]|uniref:Uncharacterized protein n=1 Tax=Amycolatopsis suaedae TaxID=2510978 RepID=A0A4Q7J506_9PSEU|nr:hypothetical protein [Amycolatopsis suaedae]RZQ61383.1 hypothetical protein EWH70_23650 [Amycolatopsis suaedae]